MEQNREETRNSLYGFDIREPDKRRVEERKTPDIKQMWSRSFEIVGMAATGLKNTEIAEVLGITPETVSNTLNSTLGMKRMSELREKRDEGYADVTKRIERLTLMAMDVYEDTFGANAEDVTLGQKLKVADTVMLELSGHRAAQKVHAVNTNASLNEIEEFKKRGKAAAKESGMLVTLKENPDGTFESTPATE